MEFTQEQMSEIISQFTSNSNGFQQLIQMGIESLMKSERTIHNELTGDVSNGYRPRRVCHNGQMFQIEAPRTREHSFYPVVFRESW